MLQSGKKHLTAQSTQPETTDKLNRYTFLEKSNTHADKHRERSKFVCELGFPDERCGLFCIRYNNDDRRLIASFGNGLIEILESNTGESEAIVKKESEDTSPIMSHRCPPGIDNCFFAAGLNGIIYKCTFEEDGHKKFAEEKLNEINAIDIDASSNTLVSGGKDATLRLYDLNTGKLKSKYYKHDRQDEDRSTTQFHAMRIFAVKFHPTEENTFMSGGCDDTLKIWDVRIKNGCVKNIRGPRICGDALDIKDKRILTGSWTVSNSLQIWDFNSGRLLENINPSNRIQTLDGEFLYCAQYFKYEQVEFAVVGGSGTSQLEVISIRDQKVIYNFPTHKTIQTIDSSAQSYIVYGGMDDTIKMLYIA